MIKMQLNINVYFKIPDSPEDKKCKADNIYKRSSKGSKKIKKLVFYL